MGDIGEAVATAPPRLHAPPPTLRSAAGGKSLEILGADVAALVPAAGPRDEIRLRLPHTALTPAAPGQRDPSYEIRSTSPAVLLGDGIRFSPPGLPRIDLEPVSTMRSGTVTILRFGVRK